MKNTKLVSIFSGLSLLVASLAPASVSALNTASMTMDGGYSSNGKFSVIVYEDTGSDTVTGANVNLTFNQPVTNVSYDYSVGPFTAVDYDGAHNAYGTVSGRNALARVSFTLASPGTVIADVSASGSYLWHVEGASVQDFAFEKGEAYFTYTPPAPKPVAAPVAPAPAAPTDTPAPLAPAKEAKTETKPAAAAKEVKSSHAGIVTSTVSALAILAAAAYWLLVRKRTEAAAAKAYKLDAATVASKNKPAKKKPAVRSNAKKSATKKK